MVYDDNNLEGATMSHPVDHATSALPPAAVAAERRHADALSTRFPSTANEALPAIEYRVDSLRVLRPCFDVGEALERRSRGATIDGPGDDLEPGDSLMSVALLADEPGRGRRTASGREPACAPQALFLDGEPVLTTPRFWRSLFSRCGLSPALFRYFDPAEVFDRVAGVDAGRAVRFTIEGDASGGGVRKLLGVSSPSAPVLERTTVSELIDRYEGHRLSYAEGVLRSTHVPAMGDRELYIGGDEFRSRFQFDVPVDGFGDPRCHVMLLRLICQNGAVATRSIFRGSIRMGKDPHHSLERALGHFANDDGFSAMRERLESAQRSWASLREVHVLERQLEAIEWGRTEGAPLRRAAFRRMVGDYEARYAIASIEALPVKRQRMLAVNCRVYDLVNFATELATHHAPPQDAARLHTWLGMALQDEFDLEDTASDVPEFAGVYMTQRWWAN